MQPRTLRLDIQGLRGVAVSAVVLDHAFGWPAGGFLGVDVFFVLSGFVIATGLLRERSRTGRIDLRAFAVRRVRRLAPASLLVLGVATVAAWVLLPASRFGSIATDAVWSALAVQNWRLGAQDTDYFAASESASPFQHFWSLGVEEQFYLVLPVLMIALLGRGAGNGRIGFASVVLAVLTVCSLTWAFIAVSVDPDAAYFSTATRAWELGLGVLAALLVHRGHALRRWVAEVMVVVGVVAIVGSIVLGHESAGVPAPLALVPTIGTALILLAGAGDRGTLWAAAPLRWPPLVGLGTISYSLYLWHWPMITLLPLFTPLPVFGVVALSVLVAVASSLTVERVFRHRGLMATLHEDRLRLQLGALSFLTVCMLVTVSTASERLRPLPQDPAAAAAAAAALETGPESDDDDSFPALSARTAAIASSVGARSWPASLSPSAEAISAPGYGRALTTTSEWASTLGCSRLDADWLASGCAWGPDETRAADDTTTSILLAGDSTAAFSAPGWRAIAEDPSAAVRVRNAARIGCPFATTALKSEARSCAAHNADVISELERTTPDVLVVTNRFWDEADPNLDGVDQDTYQRGVREMIEAASAHVGKVVVVPPTPPGYAPSNCVVGTKKPQDCRTDGDSSRSQTRSLVSALKGAPKTEVLDSRPLWCAYGTCPLVIGDVLTRSDPIHVTPEAAQASAPALLDLLRQEGILPGVRPSTP